jgi:hypothetical protein
VNEQRNGGLILISKEITAKLCLSLLAVRNAVKQTLPSFTLTKKADDQTHIAASVTRKNVLSVGIQEVGLIVGRRARTSTVSRNSSSLICSTNKVENVQYVGMSHRLKEDCMSIIVMQPKRSVGFFATDATQALGLSKKTQRFFLKQSVI